LPAEGVYKIGEGHADVIDVIKENRVDLVLNTHTRGRVPQRNGFQMRRTAVEFQVPCLTSLDLAAAVVDVIERLRAGRPLSPRALNDYLGWTAASPRRQQEPVK